MNIFFYLFILFFSIFGTVSNAVMLEDALRAHPQNVSARRVLSEARQNLSLQKATPVKKKPKPDNPQSPGSLSDNIQKERRALSKFLDYMSNHIAHSEDKKGKITPLNPHTVLRAALKTLSVGTEEHFEKIYFFNPSKENPKEEQAILQISIDFDLTDDVGRTNLSRMKEGCAPIGPDGLSMNLHHLAQHDGLLAELSGRTHRKHHRDLHYSLGRGSSEIDRPLFDSFRTKYWKRRAHDEEELRKEDTPIRRKLAKALSDAKMAALKDKTPIKARTFAKAKNLAKIYAKTPS